MKYFINLNLVFYFIVINRIGEPLFSKVFTADYNLSAILSTHILKTTGNFRRKGLKL